MAYHDEPDFQPRIQGWTPAEHELKMTALAMQISEQRLRNGDASSAEILFWMNRGTPMTKLKEENKRLENELLQAKTEALQAERKASVTFEEAMKAFQGYLPSNDNEGDDFIDGEFVET